MAKKTEVDALWVSSVLKEYESNHVTKKTLENHGPKFGDKVFEVKYDKIFDVKYDKVFEVKYFIVKTTKYQTSVHRFLLTFAEYFFYSNCIEIKILSFLNILRSLGSSLFSKLLPPR